MTKMRSPSINSRFMFQRPDACVNPVATRDGLLLKRPASRLVCKDLLFAIWEISRTGDLALLMFDRAFLRPVADER